jgi:hypothetical protein
MRRSAGRFRIHHDALAAAVDEHEQRAAMFTTESDCGCRIEAYAVSRTDGATQGNHQEGES